jgi:hypothetical protein
MSRFPDSQFNLQVMKWASMKKGVSELVLLQ